MTYRDETETLRAELDRARAELATLKSEPREVEVIKWRNAHGFEPWVIFALVVLFFASIATCAASHDVYNEGHPRASVVLAIACVLSSVTAVAIWWRALPRTKVKR